MQELLRQFVGNSIYLAKFLGTLGAVDFKTQADFQSMVNLKCGTDNAEFVQTGIDIINPAMRTIRNVTRKHFSQN